MIDRTLPSVVQEELSTNWQARLPEDTITNVLMASDLEPSVFAVPDPEIPADDRLVGISVAEFGREEPTTRRLHHVVEIIDHHFDVTRVIEDLKAVQDREESGDDRLRVEDVIFIIGLRADPKLQTVRMPVEQALRILPDIRFDDSVTNNPIRVLRLIENAVVRDNHARSMETGTKLTEGEEVIINDSAEAA